MLGLKKKTKANPKIKTAIAEGKKLFFIKRIIKNIEIKAKG